MKEKTIKLNYNDKEYTVLYHRDESLNNDNTKLMLNMISEIEMLRNTIEYLTKLNINENVDTASKSPYHTIFIPKGKLSHESKITEEYLEFMDSLSQNNIVMALLELSDIIGAIELFANKYNITLCDLITMVELRKKVLSSNQE